MREGGLCRILALDHHVLRPIFHFNTNETKDSIETNSRNIPDVAMLDSWEICRVKAWSENRITPS
jgi:hypothetical protein